MPDQAHGPEPVLSFDTIGQTFAAPGGGAPTRVLDRISFEVGRGRFTSVIGPSGCGKSTLLQMAAGLLRPSAGSVRHRGATVSEVNKDVGFVPQQAQLFPWKTLKGNVELPLILRGVAPAERERRVAASLDSVGLTGFGDHYPSQLSGGMQKRGSIARTLVYEPDVILMDEPFGASRRADSADPAGRSPVARSDGRRSARPSSSSPTTSRRGGCALVGQRRGGDVGVRPGRHQDDRRRSTNSAAARPVRTARSRRALSRRDLQACCGRAFEEEVKKVAQ